MRLRRAVWRVAGPAAGRVAPRLTRLYYGGVTRSLVRALVRDPAVRSVYAHGSYMTDEFVPGRSDVDLVAVAEELPAAEELSLLRRLRRVYLPRQAVLPLDLVTLGVDELEPGSGWLSFVRVRRGSSGPAAWRLLAGLELRASEPWTPDPALAYLTETVVADALRRRDPAGSVHAALARVDEHRARHTYSTRPAKLDASTWRVERPTDNERAEAEQIARGVPARSATLIRMPFEERAVLLLEARDLEDALPLIEAALAASTVPVSVTTSRLAEDSWRRGFRWIAIAAGDNLAGEPLAPRLRAPDAHIRSQLLAHRAFAAVGAVRRHALGMRTATRWPAALLELALVARLARGDSVVTIPEELAPGAAGLDDDAWALRALELWRAARPEYATPP